MSTYTVQWYTAKAGQTAEDAEVARSGRPHSAPDDASLQQLAVSVSTRIAICGLAVVKTAGRRAGEGGNGLAAGC